MTPQSVIDEWRPHREAIRPAGCDHRAGCWVIAPFEACADNRQGTPRCAACGDRLSAPSRTQLEDAAIGPRSAAAASSQATGARS